MSRRHHGSRPNRANGPARPADPVRSVLDAPGAASVPADRISRAGPPADNRSPLLDRVVAGTVPEQRIQGQPGRPFDEPARDGSASSQTRTPVGGAADALADRAPADDHGQKLDPDQRRDERPDRHIDFPLRVPPVPARPEGSSDTPVHSMSFAAAPPNEGQAHPNPIVHLPDRPAIHGGPGVMGSCTAPQLRRFIKSRPYVPLHELRRRFGIIGGDDDVSPIDLGERRIFVGLPAHEGSLLGELLRGGDIGFELSLDPRTPIVIGLYPMRPVARS